MPVEAVVFGVDWAWVDVGNENAGAEPSGEAVVAGLADPNSPNPPPLEVVVGFPPKSDGCGGVAAGVVDPVPNKVLLGAGVEAPPNNAPPVADDCVLLSAGFPNVKGLPVAGFEPPNSPPPPDEDGAAPNKDVGVAELVVFD